MGAYLLIWKKQNQRFLRLFTEKSINIIHILKYTNKSKKIKKILIFYIKV